MIELLETKDQNEAKITKLQENAQEQENRHQKVVESTHGAFDRIADFTIRVEVLEAENRALRGDRLRLEAALGAANETTHERKKELQGLKASQKVDEKNLNRLENIEQEHRTRLSH